MNYRKDKKKIIRELLHESDKELTDDELGQRAADAVARFAGSWAFIFSFMGVMIVWMTINVLLATKAFDAYPFVLLNLVLSCIAAVQAPLIMMSQNRQEAKDRSRAESDYRINLKSEFIIDELYKKLEQVSETQKKILKILENPSPEASKTSCDEKTENNL